MPTSQLVEMGFAEIRAKKGLMFGNGSDMDNAVNWIMEHQEDQDIDEPIPEGAEAMDVEGKAIGLFCVGVVVVGDTW